MIDTAFFDFVENPRPWALRKIKKIKMTFYVKPKVVKPICLSRPGWSKPSGATKMRSPSSALLRLLQAKLGVNGDQNSFRLTFVGFAQKAKPTKVRVVVKPSHPKKVKANKYKKLIILHKGLVFSKQIKLIFVLRLVQKLPSENHLK
jgi:hypothetical protein